MALEEIERDKYVAMIKSAPKQLQAALLSIGAIHFTQVSTIYSDGK